MVVFEHILGGGKKVGQISSQKFKTISEALEEGLWYSSCAIDGQLYISKGHKMDQLLMKKYPESTPIINW